MSWRRTWRQAGQKLRNVMEGDNFSRLSMQEQDMLRHISNILFEESNRNHPFPESIGVKNSPDKATPPRDVLSNDEAARWCRAQARGMKGTVMGASLEQIAHTLEIADDQIEQLIERIGVIGSTHDNNEGEEDVSQRSGLREGK